MLARGLHELPDALQAVSEEVSDALQSLRQLAGHCLLRQHLQQLHHS